MTRFLLNPTFDIATGVLLSHDGESFEEPKILFDRGLANTAATQRKQATALGDTTGQTALQEGGVLRSKLEQEAQNPQGYSPTDLNNMLVKQQEAAGGANATATGEGTLAALRTRNAGGFAPALAEANRNKTRALSTGALDVANQNALLKQQQQQSGLQALQGLYGTDTSNQLKAMGLSAEDLQNEMAAKRQGWVQNVNQSIAALGELGKGVGAAATGIAAF